jgi:2',3'-cyclic-nucleotide 2'-phosphodiesterase (5'-nucleotidase family)
LSIRARNRRLAAVWTRRQFLRVVGQGTLAAALPAPLLAEGGDTVTISILHTTDLHGHILPTSDYAGRPNLGGLARCATQIRAWQRANPSSILLDIGDVYQGTQVSLDTRGAMMIRCLDALGYDGWVVGNHEFDWGVDVLAECVKDSAMPVLSGNALVEGQAPGAATNHPLSRLRPYLVKEVDGMRVAIIGLTTPALASWLPPENLRGFEALDPIEALRPILGEVAALRPDAIILAGHMGLTRRDDAANQVGALTREFPQLAVYLGGHTHQNHAGEWVNGVLYTQADHYGIYAGKVDLTFDRPSRRLLAREATTVRMDHQIAFDPLVLSLCQSELAVADRLLAREVGELTEPFGALAPFGEASDQERLIGSAMVAALRRQKVEIDAVAHGLFEMRQTLTAGKKSVGDLWAILPYENQIVTIEISRTDLLALAEEFLNARDVRPLMGLRVLASRADGAIRVSDLRAADGSPLPVRPSYRIALNSYDSQSGGGRFPLLGRLVADPANRRRLYPTQIRDALIDFFVTRQKVGRGSLLV